jgi:hypothetical protein
MEPTATPVPTATAVAVPTSIPAIPTSPSLTNTPLPSVTESNEQPDGRPEEAILIQEPNSGSSVTSPVHVAGVSNPTFEQALMVRIVREDGSELAIAPLQIQSEAGKRGPFEVDVPFQASGQVNAAIQVFATSPRDGGITHLSSVGVMLTGSGEQNILSVERHLEQIVINSPQAGETLSGGVIHVEGIAIASFEQTLLIEIHDQDDKVIASQAVIVQASDLGQPGTFRTDLSYQIDLGGPGRVVVRDISPAFGGDIHRSSVEIKLEP